LTLIDRRDHIDFMSEELNPQDQWEQIPPKVNNEAEFLEIANDFGNPLEILREAISNSIDAKATKVTITFGVEEIEGAKQLVITMEDNGLGMDKDTVVNDFWGLGFSKSRLDENKIGEKGHGTKIYLRSEKIEVSTQHASGSYYSECERPLRSLAMKQTHRPRLKAIPPFQETTGTRIRVIGYNTNQRATFVQDYVKDYIYWFTKFGSIELLLDKNNNQQLKLYLKCLDKQEYEELTFGHVFPAENDDIKKLFDELNANAADHFVKYYKKTNQRLSEYPEVVFDVIISVEGDQAKRTYNSQLGKRRRKDSGRYKVGDRYGIWLCKDFIPVQRVNDWVSGFGTGSNSITLLHGFINCQTFKLTANRGTIANTDLEILGALKKAIQLILDEIDADLRKVGIFTLFEWQTEEKTLSQEKADFESRVKSINQRKRAIIEGKEILEPRYEAELFGLFIRLFSLKPTLFPFTPMDYNTSRGLDIIAKNNNPVAGIDTEYSYIELKKILTTDLNHGFKHLKWIVCWDFESGIAEGTEFFGVQDPVARHLEIVINDGKTSYYLNPPNASNKVQIIRLKEFIKENLSVEFS